jgi:UDP-4-amino-4,6-dideoxy-N-acetyl-beta-L-altrosamine transaminase
MIGYGRQWVDESDIEAVINVLRGDFLTQGPAVSAFENTLAEVTGAEHVVAVNSGTAALHLACMAAGLVKGDAAFVPAVTFAATANAVLYTGATPFFVDIEPKTLGLCPIDLERKVLDAKNHGYTPKVVLPVHYAGQPCDIASVQEIARAYNLIVIEDACHALGAKILTPQGTIPVGSVLDNNMAVLSFHPVKHITTGEGGAVTCSSIVIANNLRMLRSHGITRDSKTFVNRQLAVDPASGNNNSWYHEMQELGFNYRICDIIAALGTSQIKRLGRFVARRREIAMFYAESFSKLSSVTLPPMDAIGHKHSYHLFPIRVNFEKLKKSREGVMAELRSLGVGSQVHYIPVYLHPFYQKNPRAWAGADCANAERYYLDTLSIPMYPLMSNEEVELVVSAVKKVLS